MIKNVTIDSIQTNFTPWSPENYQMPQSVDALRNFVNEIFFCLNQVSFDYTPRLVIEVKSEVIGDASLIGLQCESGDFSDCELPKSIEPIPIGCEGVLIFSTDGNNTCGSNCNSKKSKRNSRETSSKFGGWTPYYNNDDDPDDGTGDHEHYFYFRGEDWSYRGNNAKTRSVYGKDGQAYRNCNRTAIYVRERETHVKDFH